MVKLVINEYVKEENENVKKNGKISKNCIRFQHGNFEHERTEQ